MSNERREIKLNLTKYEKGLDEVVKGNIVQAGKNVVCTVGLDMGSTSYRVRPYDETAEDDDKFFGNTIEVNSDLGIVGDISHIKSPSAKVYDALEFIIKDTTVPEEKANKMFTDVHFVKYGLFKSISKESLARPSNVSKVDLEVTYMNAIAALAMNVYLTAAEGGEVYKCYHFEPSISLPPEDFRSSIITEKFKSRLAGLYTIEMPRLGIKFDIKIKKDSIYIEKEPDAVVYSLASDYPDLQDYTSAVIDGGGKSIDVSLVVDGVIVERGSGTLTYGGTRLKEDIIDEYVRVTGKSVPPMSAIEESLDTGYLVRGKSITNMMDIIKTAKVNMAKRIYNDVLKIFDRAGVSMDDIGFLAFHGRLFLETKLDIEGMKEHEGYSEVAATTEVLEEKCSVDEYFKDIVDKVNKDYTSHTETDVQTIATGAIFSRLVTEMADESDC